MKTRKELHDRVYADLPTWGVLNSAIPQYCLPVKISRYDIGPGYNEKNTFATGKEAWECCLGKLKDRKAEVEDLIKQAEQAIKEYNDDSNRGKDQ